MGELLLLRQTHPPNKMNFPIPNIFTTYQHFPNLGAPHQSLAPNLLLGQHVSLASGLRDVQI